MSISLIIFIIIHLVTLAFFVETLRRVFQRVQEYPLEENSRTLPFGSFRLRYVIVLYIAAYLVWGVFSVWLYSYFL